MKSLGFDSSNVYLIAMKNEENESLTMGDLAVVMGVAWHSRHRRSDRSRECAPLGIWTRIRWLPRSPAYRLDPSWPPWRSWRDSRIRPSRREWAWATESPRCPHSRTDERESSALSIDGRPSPLPRKAQSGTPIEPASPRR